MDLHATLTLVAGIVVTGMAVLPRVLDGRPFSTPLAVLGFGLLVTMLPIGIPRFDPIRDGEFVEYLTEFAVLVALMGAGLRIDRAVGWRRWRSTWLLLAVTMPLTIAAAALLGWWALGLGPAAALLLGAALAPTDPVLAADVQVGPPGQGPEEEGRVGFSLTSEAGLNDALAFPFVNAAIAMALAGAGAGVGSWLGHWVLVDVLWKLAAGLAGGWLVGKLIGKLLFGPTVTLSRYSDGLLALAATLTTYGLVELAHGYGFLAVFVAAYMIRETDPEHDHHQVLNRLIEQIEHLSLAAVLLMLAAAIAGGVLDALTLEAALVGLAVVFLVRPIAGLAVGASELRTRGEALAVAFFGIRGIGSLYYLAYALNEGLFTRSGELLWATVVFTILVSVVVHGLSAAPVMKRVDVSSDRRLFSRLRRAARKNRSRYVPGAK